MFHCERRTKVLKASDETCKGGIHALVGKCSELFHPQGATENSDICKGFTSFLFRFSNGGLWENIFGSIHKQLINLTHNNTAQIYIYILDFFQFTYMDTPDIHRFPTVYMVNKHFLLESVNIGVILGCIGKNPV